MNSVLTILPKARGGIRLSLFLLCVLSVTVASGCSPKPDADVVVIQGQTMGTTYSVKVVAAKAALPSESDLKTWSDEVLGAINQSMSSYISTSELSLLNASAEQGWVDASPPLYQVLEVSQGISTLTEGAFDITVMPLVNLWGFGPKPNQFKLPSDEALAKAQEQVGYAKIELSEGKVRKPAGVTMDLSAVAKGYAVDQVASMLLEKGFANVMVEVGGELVMRGKSPRGGPWRIGVENPRYNVLVSEPSAAQTVELSDVAMATSGDYRNYYELRGKRYSHTIDPHTGRPITHKTASVTIIANTCAKADALATAMTVMGAKKGLALAEQHQVAALFIVKTDEGFESKASSAFERYLTAN